MNPLNWFRRINAELAEARERHRVHRLNRALRKRRVVIMDAPNPDERSSIAMHEAIVNRRHA
jgi:hypothetical protein